ncbi:hypothetical protein D6T17_25035 [Salmonella enterica subsp. enterica serovar Oranienburg]|nr:hypothetical protein [Salmonella enterica subsp. enterica serovar Oranienburg]EBY8947518.1 hypothetical protein [Salmonella enterica subsp. enterica serovar Oranienburg]
MAASAVKLFSRILILSSRQNSAFYNFYCLCDEKIDNGILFAGLVGVDNKHYDVGSESKLRGNIIFCWFMTCNVCYFSKLIIAESIKLLLMLNF